jgi:transposase
MLESMVTNRKGKTRTVKEIQRLISPDKIEEEAYLRTRSNLIVTTLTERIIRTYEKTQEETRASLIRMRVEIKNRIHALLDKHELTRTHNYTDLFGKQSLEWLHTLQLSNPDQLILQSSLQVVETLTEQIRSMDIQIAKDATTEEKAKLLMTMPGVDYYAAMVLLSEIGDVHRFSSDEKLVSWVGLAPQNTNREKPIGQGASPGEAASVLVGFSVNALNPPETLG